jgi:hypothetical protein
LSRRLFLPALVTTVAAMALSAGPPAAAAPDTSSTGPSVNAAGPDKGPVGWDLYRHLDRAGELRNGVQTKQFSSFDRAGGNGNDGFDGRYSCLRTSDAGCVIAEHAGPGEVQSIWFTRDYGDETQTGWIRIELDGKTVVQASLEDLLDGKVGAPFAWPLVGNGEDTAGGGVIKVPMPYRQSMRITVQHNPLFYHVSYRTFADAQGVSTFDPADKATDVLDLLRGFGLRDPKPAAPGTGTETAAVSVPAGGRTTLAQVDGPGNLTGIRVKLPQLVRSPRVVDDGRGYKGGSKFTVAVAPNNEGVRLTKRYDPLIAGQRSKLLVDGQPVGEWNSGAAQPAGRWMDQTIEVPAELTQGKSTLTISNEFVASDLDVNEFRYDVQSKVAGQWTRTDVMDVGAAHPGEEAAHGYTIDQQSWQGSRTQRYVVDSAALAKSDAVLNDTRLRITFDGKTTVDSPLGEFFGSGLGEYDTRTLFTSIDASPDGWYTAWWPMPYGQSAKVELVNTGANAITGGTAEISSVSDQSVLPALARGDVGYFNATSHRGEPKTGKDWVFLDAQGTGVYYGATQSMRGLIADGNRRAYLEGDERVYVDGALSPAMHGTGTEDFYESGWYFRDGTTYAMPTAGNPAYEVDGDGCKYDCTGTYRLLVGDAVPFGSSLRFGIEHGPAADSPADYSSTAYWYGSAGYQLKKTDSVELGGSSLTSTYEGDFDNAPVTDQVQSTTKPVTLQLDVERDNRGVRLTRLSDQQKAYQAADVQVDGKSAGRWQQPLGNETSRWLEDSFDLPSALTADKSRITVTLTPVAGSPAWTAASYEAVSRVEPFSDDSAPSQVTGVQAKGGDSNEITVNWSASRDDVGVKAYEVYASKTPGSVGTLVGTTPVPGFRHSGLGLRETWYYRVQAVDGAGHRADLSATASAASGRTAVVEAESLLPAISADAPVEAQGSCCGVTWSNNAQLWFRADSAGDAVVTEFDVPADGTYDLSAVMTKAPDYGIATLAIDGTTFGTPLDGYEPGRVAIAPPITGSLPLTKGKHRLTLTVTGKNPLASNYLAGLDLLKLTLR